MNKTRRGCSGIIRDSIQYLTSWNRAGPTFSQINEAFTLCSPGVQSMNDVMNLYNIIGNQLEAMVQYGYPYPCDFSGTMLPGYPFVLVCNRIGELSPLAGLRYVVDLSFNYTGNAGSCYDLNVLNGIGLSNYTDLAWEYQTCTEVWQPMSTNGVTDFYLPSPINQSAIFQACQQGWGVTPRTTWWESYFGGCNITSSSNIMMTQGDLDPWSTGGCTGVVANNRTDGITVHFMKAAAHHLDIRWPNELDPPDVVRARTKTSELIGSWVKEWKRRPLQP